MLNETSFDYYIIMNTKIHLQLLQTSVCAGTAEASQVQILRIITLHGQNLVSFQIRIT